MRSVKIPLDTFITSFVSTFLFIFVFVSFIKPVSGPDVLWHLKSGEYIWEHNAIPQSDPFSFAADEVSFLGKFILSQYWSSQTLLFHVFDTFGVFGLVVTRAVICALAVFFLWLLIKERGYYSSGLIIIALVLPLLLFFSEIRPQVFTTLFTALLIFLLEKWKEKGFLRYLLPIPFVMVVWANMHGGFIYGIVVMSIYVFSESLSVFTQGRVLPNGPKQKSMKGFYTLLALWMIAFSVSLVNPNTYKAFEYAVLTHRWPLYSFVVEYQSPIQTMKNSALSSYHYYIYWGCLGVAGLMAVVFGLKRKITPFMLLLFSGAMTFMAVRYIPLFIITAVSTVRHLPAMRALSVLRRSRNLLGALALAALIFAIVNVWPFGHESLYRLNDSAHYPVNACTFIKANGISGNIYVSYNKSAYVIFSLFPDSKTYFDNRYMNEERVAKGMMIGGAYDMRSDVFEIIGELLPVNMGTVKVVAEETVQTPSVRRALEWVGDSDWNALLNEINAEIIIHEALNIYTGELYPLVLKLAGAYNWKLVYGDGNVMVFLRDMEKFRDVIARHEKPKELIYEEMIMEGAKGFDRSVAEFYSSTALGLLLKGRADNNTKMIMNKALSLDPSNITANYCSALLALMSRRAAGEERVKTEKESSPGISVSSKSF